MRADGLLLRADGLLLRTTDDYCEQTGCELTADYCEQTPLLRTDGRLYCDKMKDYDEEMAEYCKTDYFSCLAAPAAGQEVLALPDRAGHLRRLRGPGHLHLLCLLRWGLLDQDPHPAGTGPVVGIYNIYTIHHYLPAQAPLLLGRARRHPPPRRQGLAVLLRDCVRRQRRLRARLPCPLHLVSESKLQMHVQKVRECDGDMLLPKLR